MAAPENDTDDEEEDRDKNRQQCHSYPNPYPDCGYGIIKSHGVHMVPLCFHPIYG